MDIAEIGTLARRVTGSAEELTMSARFVRDLPRFLRHPITIDAARHVVRERLATREARFLRIVDQTIFQRPNSPYLRLLRHAGCERGDLGTLVHRDGIEGAMTRLAERGVYVTFDELKGRREIVRGSLRFQPSDADFDQPDVAPHFVLHTGGTGGRPSRVKRSLLFEVEIAAATLISLHAHQVARPREAYWLSAPISRLLTAAKLHHPMLAWFTPLDPLPLSGRAGAHLLRALTALTGRPFPLPRFNDLRDTRPIVEWLVRAQREPDLLMTTTPSSAARLAATALEMGTDLRGTTFYLQNEPLTVARHRQVVAAGARIMSRYGSVENTAVAFCCATPTRPDDMHLMADRYALVERSRPIEDGGPEIRALMLTGIHRAIPKVHFNTELGDAARVEQRTCGCEIGALGLRTHLSDINSFEKLSGEGMTFARGNLQAVLEEILPARLGGSPIDFQLVEEEHTGGTRLVLMIDPTVPEVDPEVARSIFLGSLELGGGVDRAMTSLWRSANTLVVRRERPRATQAGKVLPLHLARGAATPP